MSDFGSLPVARSTFILFKPFVLPTLGALLFVIGVCLMILGGYILFISFIGHKF